MRNKKLGTWIWVGFLCFMLIVEGVIAGIPHVEGINVQSQALMGTPATSPTDLSGVLSPTTPTAAPDVQYPQGVKAMLDIMPLLMGVLVLWKVIQSVGGGEKK